MSIFSRARSTADDAFTPTEVAPQPALNVNPETIKDPAKMREYILMRLMMESQIAPTSGGRIAALKAMADLELVSEEAKWKANNQKEVTVNIVSVSEMLLAARERTRREALILEPPPAEIPQPEK